MISREIDRPKPEFLPRCSVAGPVGVEALEDGLQPVLGDAGTLVLDARSRRRPPCDGARMMTDAASGENEIALSIRFVTTWPKRLSLP